MHANGNPSGLHSREDALIDAMILPRRDLNHMAPQDVASLMLGVCLPGGVVDKAGTTGDTEKSPALIRWILRKKPVVSAGTRRPQWERRSTTAFSTVEEDVLRTSEDLRGCKIIDRRSRRQPSGLGVV